jgi:hypothetical protein
LITKALASAVPAESSVDGRYREPATDGPTRVRTSPPEAEKQNRCVV